MKQETLYLAVRPFVVEIGGSLKEHLASGIDIEEPLDRSSFENLCSPDGKL